jgi:hypothetical protein
MLSVGRAPAELKAVVRLLAAVDPELRRQLNRRTRETLGPVWRGAVESRLRTPLDRAVVGAGVRMKAGNPPAALAAQSGRARRGGLVPADDWAGVELGANRAKVTTYRRRSPGGTMHTVTRHTARQLPARVKGGRVAFPALREVGPRAASLWAATIVRTVLDKIEEA